MEKDKLLNIKNKPFRARNIAETLAILPVGLPNLYLKIEVGTQTFQMIFFGRIDWLCASRITEKLYRWPRFLFQPKPNRSGTIGGYNNNKNILIDCKHHSKSVRHLCSYKRLKTFGLWDIGTAINESAKLGKEQYNKAAVLCWNWRRVCF